MPGLYLVAAMTVLAAIACPSASAQMLSDPSVLFPRQDSRPGASDPYGGVAGNRRAIEDALRRREAEANGEVVPPPPPPPARPPGPSRWGAPWLAYIERAIANMPAVQSAFGQECTTIAQAVVGCRLVAAAADGAAVDTACVARQLDNRAWPEAFGKARGHAYLETFTYRCFSWIDTNQVPPLRR